MHSRKDVPGANRAARRNATMPLGKALKFPESRSDQDVVTGESMPGPGVPSASLASLVRHTGLVHTSLSRFSRGVRSSGMRNLSCPDFANAPLRRFVATGGRESGEALAIESTLKKETGPAGSDNATDPATPVPAYSGAAGARPHRADRTALSFQPSHGPGRAISVVSHRQPGTARARPCPVFISCQIRVSMRALVGSSRRNRHSRRHVKMWIDDLMKTGIRE